MLDLLHGYTEECPSLVFTSPEEERRLLLVKPVNFETLIKFSPGISIFKASYGRERHTALGITLHTIALIQRMGALRYTSTSGN